MATDITLEDVSPDAGDELQTFESFAREQLPNLAQALAVVAEGDGSATLATANATREVHARWDRVQAAPDRHLYGLAARELARRDGATEVPVSDVPDPTTQRACTVAYYGLDWSAVEIADVLGLTEQQVIASTDQAADPGDQSDDDLRCEIKRQIDEAQPHLPDLAAIVAEHETRSRRRRLLTVGTCAGVVVMVLILLGQFASRGDRVEPESPSTASISPAPSAERSAPTAIVENPGASAPSLHPPSPAEADPDVFDQPLPEQITTDGGGGFVGVRAGSGAEPTADFLRSVDGREWNIVGTLELGPARSVDRLERSGDHFILWLSDGAAAGGGDTLHNAECSISLQLFLLDPALSSCAPRRPIEPHGNIAITPDFDQWFFANVTLDQPAPQGLTYESEIADVALRDATMLALIETTIEIDFPALQLVESNTCGHSIEPERVVVKLCNGGEIDVLSVTGTEEIVATTHLLASTDGFSFDAVELPFSADAARLVSTNDSAVLTEESGRWVAVSIDGRTWNEPSTSWPAGVIAAATNDDGHVVSIELDVEPAVRTSRGSESFATPLTELIPELATVDSFDLAVAAADNSWAVLLSTGESAWLVTSVDGENWRTKHLPSLAPGQPTLVVGDQHAIVRLGEEPATTLVVDFD